MTTSLRYLAMLELIPRHPKAITVSEIAKGLSLVGFQIDRRSIQRDLNKLSGVFGIETYLEGRSQYWRFKGSALPMMLPSMDNHTALSFLILKQHASSLLPPDSLRFIEPWIRKASERLSARLGHEAKWQEKIHVMGFGIPRLPPKIIPEVREAIYRSVLEERVIRIHYRKRGDKHEKVHMISPQGIVHKNGVQYLAGSISTYNPIIFALHRIISVKPCPEEQFKKPSHDWINLQHFASTNFGYPLSEETTVKIKAVVQGETLISVAESPIASDQTLEESEDGLILSATMANNFDLWLWLRSRGADLLLIEPAFMKARLADEIAQLSRWYNPC